MVFYAFHEAAVRCSSPSPLCQLVSFQNYEGSRADFVMLTCHFGQELLRPIGKPFLFIIFRRKAKKQRVPQLQGRVTVLSRHTRRCPAPRRPVSFLRRWLREHPSGSKSSDRRTRWPQWMWPLWLEQGTFTGAHEPQRQKPWGSSVSWQASWNGPPGSTRSLGALWQTEKPDRLSHVAGLRA